MLTNNKQQQILDAIDALASEKLSEASQIDDLKARYMLYHDYYLIQEIYNLVIDIILKKEDSKNV